jgi:hypothetical protein
MQKKYIYIYPQKLSQHFLLGINYFHLHSTSSPLSITNFFYYLFSKQKRVLHESIQSEYFKYSFVTA